MCSLNLLRQNIHKYNNKLTINRNKRFFLNITYITHSRILLTNSYTCTCIIKEKSTGMLIFWMSVS